MRADWTERHARQGWDVAYTNVGGRSLRSPLDGIDETQREPAERAVAQVFVAATPAASEASPEVAYWATVCRKIVQRGTNPVLCHRVIEALPSPTMTPDALSSAVAGPVGPPDVDPQIDLHPVHEVPFWTRVTNADPRLARWISPQAPLEALAGRSDEAATRWVDFLVAFPWDRKAAVVEVDGSGHERQPGVDKVRDKLLADAGIPVVRIPGTEVHSDQSTIMQRIEDSVPAWHATVDCDELRAVHAPPAANRLAFALVEAVERGHLAAGRPWNVTVTDHSGMSAGMEPVALDLVSAVADAWDISVVPESITVNGRAWSRGSDGRYRSDGAGRSVAPDVEIRLEPFVPPHAPLEFGHVPAIVVRGTVLPVDLPWTRATSAERRNRVSSIDSDAALARLLRDIYGYDEFREGQEAAISRVLSGGDTCVLLPTGAGKSLIYQLAGLLRPGVTLIVAPLKSLIDDQVRRLEDSGIDRVSGLHSGSTRSASAKIAVQESIASGESLFVFVAPERLQIEDFRLYLREAAAHQQINLAVVDEAHCVSEWGHQFRTSYLKLGRNLRRFCAGDDDVPPPILALTATASPRVLNDLLDELGLDRAEEGVLHRPKSFDRPNLSYRILRGNVAGREALVSQSLYDIAAELGVPVDELGEALGDETLSGIVFVPHASSGLDLGIVHYRDLVADTLEVEDSSIALFAGTKPKELKGLTKAQWEEEKARYAAGFRQNELPVMVSTNAFGMGIDKPNIRYTVHATQPSSIEAFAQEAGRSGRDGQDSFCYLVSSNAQGVDHTTIDNKSAATISYAKDDILIQLGNLMSAFPAAEAEKSSANDVLTELRRDGVEGRSVVVPMNTEIYPTTPDGWRAQEKERRDRERAIYRLLLLGVVDDYTIDYGAAGNFTVYLNILEAPQILDAARSIVERMAGGSQKFTAQLDGLDDASLDQVLPAAIDALIDALYGTVEPGRTNALREMYLMTRLDDPEAIREKINAYLSDGPVALILDKVVRQETNLSETLQQLGSTPESTEEWAGAAARYLDAYAEHPVLLVVRALGEAWRENGSREEFARTIERLASSLPTFGLPEDEQLELVRWLLDQLRTYFGGGRWAWAPDIWHALEDSDVDRQMMDTLENEVLDRAAAGAFNPAEVETVVARRLRSVESATTPVVNQLANVG